MLFRSEQAQHARDSKTEKAAGRSKSRVCGKRFSTLQISISDIFKYLGKQPFRATPHIGDIICKGISTEYRDIDRKSVV